MTVEQIMQLAQQQAQTQFQHIDSIALANQRKVLRAFQKEGIAERHFRGTTGYGYGDLGREALARVYADVFGTEQAIVSPLITGGTHALVLALFGVLRPGDTLVSVSGEPYDTLYNAINGTDAGGMKEYNIRYDQIELTPDGRLDNEAIACYVQRCAPKVVFVTRSRGYSERNALSVREIGEMAAVVHRIAPQTIVFADNCYGEFCDDIEPTEVGCDLAVGSLIKNPGGGIAPTGGYIVGRGDLIDRIAARFIAPGLGCEVGSYAYGYQYYFQGLFVAPHTVACALKSSVLFAHAFSIAGCDTIPAPDSPCNDIIRSIRFDTQEQLVRFIQGIQRVSPVDSNVVPYPWDMPGYQEPVIMAAGCFVGGASIELSADAPIKEPYIAYIQGALTYEHAQIAVEYCLQQMIGE